MPFRFFSSLPICFMTAIAMLPVSGAYGQDQTASSGRRDRSFLAGGGRDPDSSG